MTALITTIIPVHSSNRPIYRAVSSVLRNQQELKVFVVCHNVAKNLIADNLKELVKDPRVELLELADGIPSPSEPLNFGLANTTTKYVNVLGSDDEFEPGAIDYWVKYAQRYKADALIARVIRRTSATGVITKVQTPPTRPFRQKKLNPIKDRLSYRAAFIGGVIRKDALQSIRYTPGMRTGGDIEFTLKLYFSSLHKSLVHSGPAYVVHDDNPDRVTEAPVPPGQELHATLSLLEGNWFQNLGFEEKSSIVIKLLRSNLFNSISNRIQANTLSPKDIDELQFIATKILESSPTPVESILSKNETLLIESLNLNTNISQIHRRLNSLQNFRTPKSLFSTSIIKNLHSEARFRYLIGIFFRTILAR